MLAGREVNVSRNVSPLVRVQHKGLGARSLQWLFCGQGIATKSEGVEWKLGVYRQFGVPGSRFFAGLSPLPKTSNLIGPIAVINLNVRKALLLGGRHAEVGAVLVDMKRRRWGGRDVLLNTGEVLLEPLIEHDPLLRSRAVSDMHIATHTPVVMREQVHGLVDPVEGGVLVIG